MHIFRRDKNCPRELLLLEKSSWRKVNRTKMTARACEHSKCLVNGDSANHVRVLFVNLTLTARLGIRSFQLRVRSLTASLRNDAHDRRVLSQRSTIEPMINAE